MKKELIECNKIMNSDKGAQVGVAVGLGVAVAAGISYIISDHFYKKAIDRSNTVPICMPKEPIDSCSVKNGREWIDEVGYDIWEITSFDQLKLRAYYIPSLKPTNKTVIIAHGYGMDAKSMGDFAKFYRDKLGFNVLLPDARGHGMSEGHYKGFGWHERIDYLKWIELVNLKNGWEEQIVLHGLSMGGATVMMTSGEILPPNVKAIVEDCGYTSAYEQIRYQFGVQYKIPKWLAMPSTNILTKLRAGYTFKEASAIKQVEKNRVPMLFIHGEDDDYVPYEMVRRLFDACNAPKEIYTVSGANHADAFYKNPSLYIDTVSSFLKQYIG